MHIDLAPPLNGTYNSAGSNRQLTSYLEYEDLGRVEKGIYTESLLNFTNDNIRESKVIKDIDTDIGQLLKTGARSYAVHVSPSKKELQAIGNTEHEQAESMKRCIWEMFIPEHAKSFNKELPASDTKPYGKIYFSCSRSGNEQSMHRHSIVSREGQASKKKLSPLTNHKNIKNGVIKDGSDRVSLFRQTEEGFGELLGHEHQQLESSDYQDTTKNGNIINQLKLQEQELQSGEKKTEINQDNNQESLLFINLENKETDNQIVYRRNRSDRL